MNDPIDAQLMAVKTFQDSPTQAVSFDTSEKFTASMEGRRIRSTAPIRTVNDTPAKVSHDRRILTSIYDEFIPTWKEKYLLKLLSSHPKTTKAKRLG